MAGNARHAAAHGARWKDHHYANDPLPIEGSAGCGVADGNERGDVRGPGPARALPADLCLRNVLVTHAGSVALVRASHAAEGAATSRSRALARHHAPSTTR